MRSRVGGAVLSEFHAFGRRRSLRADYADKVAQYTGALVVYVSGNHEGLERIAKLDVKNRSAAVAKGRALRLLP